MTVQLPIRELRQKFAQALQQNELLSRHTSARVGGPADVLLTANSNQLLQEMVVYLWRERLPFIILGGGSNVLVSDSGFRGVVVLNRARNVEFRQTNDHHSVWAESGANFGSLARHACQRGLGGLEWAVGVPGTVGGAVVGNAGAHGADMASNLLVAEILHLPAHQETSKGMECVKENWPVEKFAYAYRSSLLKQNPGQYVVLSVELRLEPSTQAEAQAKADAFTTYRQRTQPPGATMGSMFKNPPGDYAGRLIEAAGLKGLRIGEAQISELHANFFVNLGQAAAVDIYRLIEQARQAVLDQFGVSLELEVELVGDWQIERAGA
jgi:UDP-N-acetylmuramate dehydrogenase